MGTIFGEGAGYPIIVIGERLRWFIHAHSDWLNIAIAYGLIGLALFSFLFIGILRMIILAKKTSSEILDMLISLFIISLCALWFRRALESSFALPFAVLGMAGCIV